MLRKLVLASSNKGKAREIAALLGDSVELILQDDLDIESVEETGTSFAENALLKARHAAARSGLPALADDSGIEVDYLAGAPGVYSARFAGADASDQDNVDKLLAALKGVEDAQRGARFRCVLAFVTGPEDADPLLVEAAWEGRIGYQEAGSNGFGYDPVFIVAGMNRTSAELEPAEKNRRSHRGQALAKLREELLHLGLLPQI